VIALRARTGLAALCGALLLAGPAGAARSVNAGGLCTWWSQRGHPFTIDPTRVPVPGTSAIDAIRRSFQTWSQVSCTDLTFRDDGLLTDPKLRRAGYFSGDTNQNLILFRTANCQTAVPAGDACIAAGTCGNQYDCWSHDQAILATTTTTSNRTTGEILDSDTEFNAAPAPDGSQWIFSTVDSPPCSAPGQTDCVNIDVQNTMTHEAGHTLGLAHSMDTSATMYASAPEGETAKRILKQDDLDSICGIYPRGAQTVTCLGKAITITEESASDGATGCGCSAAGAGPALEGAVLSLFAFLTIHRRRRPGRAGESR
jgi:MYXO-CTERM domain-containing protein